MMEKLDLWPWTFIQKCFCVFSHIFWTRNWYRQSMSMYINAPKTVGWVLSNLLDET
jgi:hypothetical protein